MARFVIWMVFVVVRTVADNTAPQASGSMSVSTSEPAEYGRVVMQCQVTVSNGQVVAISKDNQPISWDGDLLPSQDPQGPGSSRFTLSEIPQDPPGNVISLLTIQPVCKQDRGNYSCTVYQPRAGSGYDVVQSPVSIEISSVVDYDSTDMCNPVGPVVALTGDVVSFGCTSRSAVPVWTLDDGTVVVSTGTHDAMQNTHTREITLTVSEDHQGLMYHCTASPTGCGSSEASMRECTVGPITVLPEPQVVVSSAPNPIVIGGVAEFLCTVLPNITSLTYRVSWHTVPSLGNNRAYFSSTGPSRMRLLTVKEEDQGMDVHCTVYFDNGKQATGHTEFVVSTESPGQTVVDPTAETTPLEASTGDTPVTSTLKPGQPFLIFGSYPATIGIIGGGSILVALLLALIVYCCCRKCKRQRHGKPTTSKRPLRISPSTFGGPNPGHEVPGSGTDGMYMYATIFDPDEKWGATPTKQSVMDSHGYQEPMVGSTPPPVYSRVVAPNFDMETNVDQRSPQVIQVSTPGAIVDNALYQSSGEYVNPETANQQHINREMTTIRLEKHLTTAPMARQASPVSSSSGYLAIGEVPVQVRAGNSNAKNAEPVTYMEISN